MYSAEKLKGTQKLTLDCGVYCMEPNRTLINKSTTVQTKTKQNKTNGQGKKKLDIFNLKF